MILDHYMYTRDAAALAKYLPIVDLTLEFFRQHYPLRDSAGKMSIHPTQALETYWCGDQDNPMNSTNCLTNDAPTVAGLHALTERVLGLPQALTTATQREHWSELAAMLPEVL